MTDSRHRRSLLARIRDKLDEPITEPEPPRRTHEFGSQYRVRMSFDEVMAARGYTGRAALDRRRLVPANDAQPQRDAALSRAGYTPGEVLWPSD